MTTENDSEHPLCQRNGDVWISSSSRSGRAAAYKKGRPGVPAIPGAGVIDLRSATGRYMLWQVDVKPTSATYWKAAGFLPAR